MKKAILAVCMIAAMLFAAAFNIRYLEKMTNEMTDLISECVEASDREDWQLAVICAEQAKNMWNRNDGYTHIVLRHSEIDTVADALYEFMSGIYEKSHSVVTAGAEKVIYHLDSIYKMEQVRFGSIF